MPNFNYAGPKITPDVSKIDQASQQSFQQMASIEVDRYKRRQEMIARAMDFVNIEVPETALQDQKALADKFTTFKQNSIDVFKSASDQNRELNFDESAQLAKQKSALLKEAQAYNMYHQLLTHATSAYIADPEKYEEEFLNDISEIDFKKTVEERTNPMTILAANIYQPGFDIAGFEKKVGDPNKYYLTDNKGYTSLDTEELRRNINKNLQMDAKVVRKGIRTGLWADEQGASDYIFEYMSDKFTKKIPRPRVGKTGGTATEIPKTFSQPQVFKFADRDYGFATAVDLQKAGPTIVNEKTIQPVSVGFAPEAKEDMEFTVSRPKNFSDPFGIFPWSKQKIKIKAGEPIPAEFVGQVDQSKYDYKPYITFKGKTKNSKGEEEWNTELSIAPYDEKVRTAFANGTNTKDAHKYITELEADAQALQNITGKTQGATAKPATPAATPAAQPASQPTGTLSPVGLDLKTAQDILGDDAIKALTDNGYIVVGKDGVLVLNFDSQAQMDAFNAAAKAKGYTTK